MPLILPGARQIGAKPSIYTKGPSRISYRDPLSKPVVSGGGGYVAKAVHWDGSVGDQVLHGIPAFPTSSTTMLCAGWLGNCTGVGGSGAGFAFNTANGATGDLFLGFQGNGDDTSFIDMELYDNTQTAIVVFRIFPFLKDLRTGWHSFAIFINTATQTIQMVIDRNAVDTSSAVWTSSNPIALLTNDPYVFDTGSSGPGLACDFSDNYINFGNFSFDLTDMNNLNKLFSIANKPISWGNNGSLVTGAAPQIFLSGDDTNYGANLGSGGALTPQNFSYGDGVITNASTSPSD